MTRNDSLLCMDFPFFVSSLRPFLRKASLPAQWCPGVSHGGSPREGGIGQRTRCRDRVTRAWGARILLRGRAFHPVELSDLG